MRILVSNDDGIEALGIAALVNELSKYHEVIVVAPHTQKSASSHSLTISGSLKVKEMALYNNVKSWAVYGTPADCVHLAIKRLLDESPD